MGEISELLKDIEKLRKTLNDLISKSETLKDPEVIEASQILNDTITKYNRLIEKKIRK